ncbi:hypothetical protein D0Y65_012379 [Glycine soja]|uniref:Uncharacterized protein n=1 Tax=Glycine soja TaxID=3848 RepID=A0A445KNS3_GLYSO|nr:hypothetical protein D0Y65_012379 [Glycine soja]
MSRCFPFPPPGYGKKAITDEVDLLKKVSSAVSKILIFGLLCVINGRWWKAKILPYKHAIAPYGAAMEGVPSQIEYGGWSMGSSKH